MGCSETNRRPDEKGHCPPMSAPRLSFSNDFVESHHPATQNQKTPTNISRPSDDFEFSNPNNHTMTAADELFFKGKLLPTLKDELLLDDDDDNIEASSSFVPPKGLPKWKEFLSLKRSVDGRCTGNNSQGKMPKLAVDDKPHLAI